MATYGSSRARARFAWFQVDLSSGELFRSGVRVPIQEQPLQVLRLLVEAEGKVVTREQLRAALWPEDTFVDFEHGVNTAVKKLRQALEDSAERPKFVETLPKFGYRFIVPVEWTADSIGMPATPGALTMNTATNWSTSVTIQFCRAGKRPIPSCPFSVRRPATARRRTLSRFSATPGSPER